MGKSFDFWYSSNLFLCYFNSVATSPSGWTDNEICQEWMEQTFMPFASSKRVDKKKPVILILDSHESHENWELKRKIYSFAECDLIVFCFPSKTTHKLQPLDVVVFSPIGRGWRDHCDTQLHRGITINQYNVIPEYLQVHQKCLTKELIEKAFEKTGIYPVNPNIFTKEDFAPSKASSSKAHVPDSFPDDVPSSDLAIPSDAESDSEMEIDEDEEGDADYIDTDMEPEEMDDHDLDLDSDDQVNDTHGGRESSGTTTHSTSVAAYLDFSDLIYQCRAISLCDDESKSRNELLEEVLTLRQQLRKLCGAFDMQAASIRAANAHCTIVKRALEDCRTQIQNNTKKRE